jgi:ABC-type sugar transport system permease subunit
MENELQGAVLASAPATKYTKWQQCLEPYIYIMPAMLVLVFVFIYPIIQMFRYGLMDVTATGERIFVGLRNYQMLVTDPIFWTSIRNNALLFLCIPILLFLSVIIASLLYDRVVGWQVYRVIIFMPFMMAIVVVGIAFSYILQFRGALNFILTELGLGFLKQDWIGAMPWAFVSIAVVIIWREMGFGSILFLARLMCVSEELYDAAKVDGASWLQRLRHVTFPQLRNVMAFWATILAVEMFAWVFNYVYVMTQGGPSFKTTVSEYYIYLHAFKYNSMGTATAFSSILFLAASIIMFVQLMMRERMEENGQN